MNEIKTLTVKATIQENRVIRFVASDESLDRDGDIVISTGWRVENYLKNPIVLYGHNYDKLPVGKAKNVIIDPIGKQLIIDVQFPRVEEVSTGEPSEHALFVDSVYNLAKLGLLNAVSVGFRGIKVEPILDVDGNWTGRKFLEQELMELSIVPVPANVNAVAIMRGAKIDEKLCAIVEKSMKSGRRLSSASVALLSEINDKFDKVQNDLYEACWWYRKTLNQLAQQEEEQGNTPEAKNAEGIIEIVDTHLYEFDEPKNGKIN